MREKRLICVLLFLPLLWLVGFQNIISAQTSVLPTKPFKFINGQWYDGKNLKRRTFYSVNGILSKRRPQGDVETIDLANGFVVPPFGETHNHNLGSAIYLNREYTQKTINQYLADGVFYVKIPGNPGENAAILRRELIDRPDTVDVSFSNGVLTSKDGHPIGMTLDSFKQANLAVPKVADLEGKGFFIIESESDLVSKWDQIIAGKPDFIKTILRHSENFAARRETPSLFGYNGLDPQLLPRIVKQAHAAGLRVTTHIDSAADFAAAVDAHVDEIAHLPGAIFEKGTTAADYLIKPEYARRAAKQGTLVVTTASIAPLFAKGEDLGVVQSVQRANIKLLKENGVRIALGSDNFTDTSLGEAMYLKSLDVFSNAEILKMWTVTSPQTIFPHRKIAFLKNGYEASFIVLSGNPLENFDHVKDIQLRFKQGHLLKVDREGNN